MSFSTRVFFLCSWCNLIANIRVPRPRSFIKNYLIRSYFNLFFVLHLQLSFQQVIGRNVRSKVLFYWNDPYSSAMASFQYFFSGPDCVSWIICRSSAWLLCHGKHSTSSVFIITWRLIWSHIWGWTPHTWCFWGPLQSWNHVIVETKSSLSGCGFKLLFS